MKRFDGNEDFVVALQALIEHWCDRRCLRSLHHVLGAYLAFNGLTDSWGDLHLALQNVRAFARTELKADELKELNDLINAAARTITRVSAGQTDRYPPG
jgi:hypothetical protein